MKPSEALYGKLPVVLETIEKYRVSNPRVFGSVAVGQDREDSDIDILVDPNSETTLFDLGGLQGELEKLLGVRVDLLTPGDLPSKLRNQVFQDSLPLTKTTLREIIAKAAQAEIEQNPSWLDEIPLRPARTMRPPGTPQRQTISGRATAWLRIAALIATRNVNATHLCEDLGLSRNSVVRHLADLERVYGFVVEYVRHPDGARLGGWYEVVDWGVLNEAEVVAKYGPSAWSQNS